MLGADAAAQFGHLRQDHLVDPLVVRRGAGHVDVDVAVPEVTEQPGVGVGGHRGDPGGYLGHELRHRPDRHGHVELVGWSEGVDGEGVVLAIAPQGPTPGGIGGHGHVPHVGRGDDRGGQLIGRIVVGGHLDQYVHRPARGERRREPERVAHQAEPLVEEQLGRLEAIQR